MFDALGHIAFGLFGLAVLVGIAFLFSNNKRAVSWKLVLTGVTLQIVFASLVLKLPLGRDVFNAIATGFVRLLDFVRVGSEFIFGSLTDTSKFGFVFAVQVLPTIIFFASLTGVLYHLGIMQQIVRGMAWIITKVMNVSGAETTSVCASVFIGQTEAPLTIKPYIERMTESELMTVMIGGMAHIAGSVMAAYVGLLGGDDPMQKQFFAKHLLTASVMAAPATLMLAKILVPETKEPLTRGTVKLEVERTTANVIDAAATGAGDGLRLALNVGAMLLAFIALIALVNCADPVARRACVGRRRLDQCVVVCQRRPPGRSLAADDIRLGAVAAGVADRRAVAGRESRRQLHRRESRRQRVRRVRRYVQASRPAHPAEPADRDVCAVRLCELLVDRDPDRRHRRPRAEPARGSRAPWPARRARRIARDVHDRDDRRRARAALIRAHSAFVQRALRAFTSARRISFRFTARFA